MAQPVTRKEFKEWCLRKLGKPVIEINVDPDQVDDRVDEGDYLQSQEFVSDDENAEEEAYDYARSVIDE